MINEESQELIFGKCESGFFSCCNLVLMYLIDYFNKYHKLPLKINTQNMFEIYQLNNQDDVFKHCFYEKEDINIDFKDKITFSYTDFESQFSDYKQLNFHALLPFIEKYYNITETIKDKIKELKNKYNIDEEQNYCGVFYRGNDKVKETQKPSYEDMVRKALEIKEKNKDVIFIIQTDENEFLQYFLGVFPNSIYFKEIPVINNQMTSVAFVYCNNSNKIEILEYYIASVFILSSLKNIIHTSGNAEFFMMLFRKNANGSTQYLKKNEYIHGVYNHQYNPNETQFWF